jgi:hypothetical protein
VFVVGASHAKETMPLPVTVTVAVPETLPDVAVIVVEPPATAVAKPLDPAALLILATDAVDEFHVTDVVRFCVELSEYVPVAVNCCDAPCAMVGLVGVIARETSVAAVTVSVAVPDTLPDLAVIVVEPAATEVALPLEPAALLIAATVVFDELQDAVVVRIWVELLEYVPVAVNCWVVPLTMLEVAGVTAMDTRVAEVTVSAVVPTTLPDVAVIVDEPAATDVANPLEPAALLMAAIDVADDFQVTDVVRFCVVLSEYVPVAVNCLDVPSAMLVLIGETTIEISVAGVTVIVALPETLPDVAEIVVEPGATEVAKPFDPAALLMAAIDAADDFQVTPEVRFCVEPSE